MDPEDVVEEIGPVIERYFEERSQEFDPENPSVPLVDSPYGAPEVKEALESMLSTYVTSGEKVAKFEDRWSDYIGVEHGVMTNSGSSANLAAMKALEKDLGPGSEVIVPAVGWSTTFFPVIDAGAEPVFVDVDPENFTMDIEGIKRAVNGDTAAVVPVHLLGNPAPMNAIKDISEDHGLALVEDCAEAHGAEVDGRRVGSFGDVGAFSFSFSHHMTTTEGGMAVTDSGELHDSMESIRSWGRVGEEREGQTGSGLGFEFTSHGYNLRPTELQAAFGIHQVERMDGFVEKRRENARYLDSRLEDIDDLIVLEERKDARSSYLHYPLVVDRENGRKEMREHLEDRGIETRPVLSGNVTRHAAFSSAKVSGRLEGADRLHDRGLYVSVHPYLSREHLDHVVASIRSFF